jgi:hypothetical protein
VGASAASGSNSTTTYKASKNSLKWFNSLGADIVTLRGYIGKTDAKGTTTASVECKIRYISSYWRLHLMYDRWIRLGDLDLLGIRLYVLPPHPGTALLADLGLHPRSAGAACHLCFIGTKLSLIMESRRYMHGDWYIHGIISLCSPSTV